MKKWLMLGVFAISAFAHANPSPKFEVLQTTQQLDQACEEDDADVFEPQHYQLNVGKVTLHTYSCLTKKNGNTQYYSSYAVKLASGQQFFFNDQAADASGYVGVTAHRVDYSTVVFDSMYERGGDLILIGFADAQHVYSAKIPYMASDESGVEVTAQGQKIILQKRMYTGENKKGEAQYKNIGQALILKKENAKGFIYQAGHIKNFQQEAFK